MSNCIAPGWGTGPWGKTPWGATGTPVIGGPLPVHAPFDIYCVGPCGEMGEILTHPEVTTDGDGSQFSIDGPTLDLVIGSGGTYLTSEAGIVINTPVPETWTLDFTLKARHIPPNFSNLTNSHIFVGASDAVGPCAGLFISRIGLMYTGCVHVSGGNLVLDTPVQPLADSQLLIEEDEYISFRIATDEATRTTYIYVTKTVDLLSIGHQLRYVLPAIESSSAAVVPPDQTQVQVRGTMGVETEVLFDSICLGTGLVIPNLPPRADAGLDQSVRTCTVALLDGTKSFDPEGAPLIYRWRLLDAPLNSKFIFDSTDGFTYPLSPPTGFTNRFYSVALQTLHGIDPIMPGDVLLTEGTPFNIIGVGSDINGFFVAIDAYDLPDNLSTPAPFHLLRQRGVSNRSSSKPTFYPDVPGLYKFDLIVFDGNLFSLPSVTVLNVVESPLPRGCIPDLRFLWGYLSDFWKLVEDKERIEVFWGGLAQIAAAELLTLWQVEYSKSLRDIQRTFRRKWLRFELGMQENPLFLEQTTVRAVFGGIESSNIPNAGLAVGGEVLEISIPGNPIYIVTISGPGLLSADSIASQIQGQLQGLNPLFSVITIPNQAATAKRIRIDAPFSFSNTIGSTLSIFTGGDVNGCPTGTAGVLLGIQTYKIERSLQGVPLQQGDFLVLDDIAYRIARIVTDVGDTFASQRITTIDPIPLGVPAKWSISGQAVSKTLDFWKGLVSTGDVVTFEVLRLTDGQLAYVVAPSFGASEQASGTLAVDASPIGVYLAQPELYTVYFAGVLRRKYTPIDPLVVDVPYLQELINNTDDTQVLRRNVDYFLETFRKISCVRFIVGTNDVWQGEDPPDHLWAENTYLDNRPMIESNFGLPAEFTLDDLSQLPSNVDYLSAVRGLWYAYFNGPTLFNLRAGTQILLGLPFAEEAGIITEIRDDFSTTNGRILVEDSANAGVVRSYSFPASLPLEVNPTTGRTYAVGDTVAQFSPLVQGVEVLDYVKQKDWFLGYLQQGAFYEVEKFFKFLVRVDSAAFNLSALLFVKNFILRIKPTYTYPLFVVLLKIGDTEISTTDLITYTGTLNLFAGPCFRNMYGNAQMFDQPNSAGGGWMAHYDSSQTVPPTYPTPTYPLVWGFDQYFLCPEDLILGTLSLTYGAPTIPQYDSIFEFDTPVDAGSVLQFVGSNINDIQVSPGQQVDEDKTSAVTGTINTIHLDVDGWNDANVAPYTLILKKNGSTVSTQSFVKSATGKDGYTFTVAIATVPGDVFQVFIYSATERDVLWHAVGVELEQSVPWAFDTLLPPGSYQTYRTL